jgi:hypothetical protein
MVADLAAQFGPALVGAAISGGVILAPMAVDLLLYQIKLKRMLPIIRRSFEIIDPLLNEHLAVYGPSDVRFAINLTTQVLADGILTPEEARFAYDEIEKRFSPVKAAAAKPILEGTQERAIYDAIKAMVDKGGRPSMADIINAAKAVKAQAFGVAG